MGKPGDDNEFEESGVFSWDESGSNISLNPSEGENSQYKVGENHLLRLNQDGEINTGELAELYVLQKKID